MIYGKDVLQCLASRFVSVYEESSSHWQFYHEFLEIDESLSVRKTRGFGDGRKHFFGATGLADHFLQKPFTRMINEKESLLFFSKIAKKHCRIQSRRFSLDVLRQVLTLTYLKSEFNRARA